jgi:hypothetical protein
MLTLDRGFDFWSWTKLLHIVAKVAAYNDTAHTIDSEIHSWAWFRNTAFATATSYNVIMKHFTQNQKNLNDSNKKNSMNNSRNNTDSRNKNNNSNNNNNNNNININSNNSNNNSNKNDNGNNNTSRKKLKLDTAADNDYEYGSKKWEYVYKIYDKRVTNILVDRHPSPKYYSFFNGTVTSLIDQKDLHVIRYSMFSFANVYICIYLCDMHESFTRFKHMFYSAW